MVVRQVQIEEQDLAGIPSRQCANEVQRYRGSAGATLRRVHGDHRRLPQEDAPAGLGGCLGEGGLALLRQPRQVRDLG